MQEGLEQVARFGDRDDAGGARVVDAVVEVVDAARVDDLLAADVRAGQRADATAELGHGAVVLRAAEQPHVRIGQVLGHWQRLAVRTHKRACAAGSRRVRD